MLCGVPIVLEAIYGLITKFDIKADVLVSIALIASIYIGEYFAAGEVAFIMQLGALLENLTVAKSRTGIKNLALCTPQAARSTGRNDPRRRHHTLWRNDCRSIHYDGRKHSHR